MSYTYADHAERLMRENVGPDCVGGFMTYTDTEERLYSLTHDGMIYARTAPRPNVYFHPSPDKKTRTGTDWHMVEFIPDNAEWIGSYLSEFIPA